MSYKFELLNGIGGASCTIDCKRHLLIETLEEFATLLRRAADDERRELEIIANMTDAERVVRLEAIIQNHFGEGSSAFINSIVAKKQQVEVTAS
jgi:hypothetical protein